MYIRRTSFAQGFIQNSSFHCAAQEEEEKQIEEKRPSRGKKRTRNRKGDFSHWQPLFQPKINIIHFL